MRVLRAAGGLILVGLGLVALLLGTAGWVIGDHRGANGSFIAELAPVHTDGYAITVPDVSGTIARHGAGRVLDDIRLLGDARLTLTVRVDRPAVVALVPSAEASRYLTGVRRTEVVGVGFATGAQPVAARDLQGTRPVREMPRTAPWVALNPDRPFDLSLPLAEPMALVIMRADRDPDFSATMTAGLRPASWSVAVWLLLFVGSLCLVSGTTLLVRRQPRDETERFDDEWAARLSERDEVPRPSAESPYVHTAT